jgi:hypothetical protein
LPLQSSDIGEEERDVELFDRKGGKFIRFLQASPLLAEYLGPWDLSSYATEDVRLDRDGFAMNTLAMVGHSSIRRR